MNDRRSERGQILPLFTLVLVALLGMGALLFDGAQALVLRRQLQDAGDAAALAAANVVQSGNPRGCSANAGPPPGNPRGSVVQAARDSIAANLPDYPLNEVVVSCPAGWYENQAVRVELRKVSQSFIARAVASGDLTAATTSTAMNGQLNGIEYSIVQLDPGNPSWPNGRRGCPSVLLSGGPTVTLESTMHINSACSAAAGGALATNGNAASLTMSNGARIRIVGGYAPAALTINPAPLTGQTPLPDPLAFLPPLPVSSLPVQSPVKFLMVGGSQVLNPGRYIGGIELRSSAKVFLNPGIYVMEGGGFSVGAQSEVYSVRQGVTSTTTDSWASDCPQQQCGVLIYNTGDMLTMGSISVAAGAVFKLRSYRPELDPNSANYTDYQHLLIWQSASPVPSSLYAQPPVRLWGGGNTDMGGTVYAPSAVVEMGGSSGGSGGGAVDMTLQFISWDLTIQGNASFYFRYLQREFVRPTDYGLVE
ncbi:MAG TPA: pilus assembly protein TadG-related protein [Candidatus Limnocylindrales bacterium]|nr:pilus assembly protein TadG-related protein [Candidatus Limnocylindrales bacterium]